MKKMFGIAFAALLLSILSAGCGMGNNAPEIKPVSECSAAVMCGDTSYSCVIRRISQEQIVLTFSSPERLSGMTYSLNSSGCSLSVGKCVCRNIALPDNGKSVFAKICNALERLSDEELEPETRSDDGRFVFSSKNKDGLSVVTDSSGQPLTVKTQDITMELSQKE